MKTANEKLHDLLTMVLDASERYPDDQDENRRTAWAIAYGINLALEASGAVKPADATTFTKAAIYRAQLAFA